MISKYNIGPIALLCQRASKEEINVLPDEGTPVAEVVIESTPSAEVLAEGRTSLESIVEVRNIGEEDNEADALTEEYAQALGEGIREQAKTIVERVLPTIAEIHDATVNGLAEITAPTYDIKQVGLAAVHDNPTMYEVLRDYENIPREQVGRPYGYPAKDEEELVSYLATGSNIIDGLVAEMLAAHPSGFVKSVYDEYFGSSVKDVVSIHMDFLSMDKYLVAFLLAEYFIKNPVPELEPYSAIMTHETVLLKLRNQLGHAMIRTHRSWDTQKSSGFLVLRYAACSGVPTEQDDATITVIGDVYQDFLGAGGSPEMVIGANCSSRDVMSSELLSKKDHLNQMYAEYQTRVNDALAYNKGSYIRRCAVNAVSDIREKIDPEYLAPNLTDSEAIALFAQQMSEFEDAELCSQLYSCVRLATCYALFGATDSLNFLARMDAYQTRYPDMDNRVAAYYVAADLIVQHLCSQVKTTH